MAEHVIDEVDNDDDNDNDDDDDGNNDENDDNDIDDNDDDDDEDDDDEHDADEQPDDDEAEFVWGFVGKLQHFKYCSKAIRSNGAMVWILTVFVKFVLLAGNHSSEMLE